MVKRCLLENVFFVLSVGYVNLPAKRSLWVASDLRQLQPVFIELALADYLPVPFRFAFFPLSTLVIALGWEVSRQVLFDLLPLCFLVPPLERVVRPWHRLQLDQQVPVLTLDLPLLSEKSALI